MLFRNPARVCPELWKLAAVSTELFGIHPGSQQFPPGAGGHVWSRWSSGQPGFTRTTAVGVSYDPDESKGLAIWERTELAAFLWPCASDPGIEIVAQTLTLVDQIMPNR